MLVNFALTNRKVESEFSTILASASPGTMAESGTITPPARTVPIIISGISMQLDDSRLTLSPF